MVKAKEKSQIAFRMENDKAQALKNKAEATGFSVNVILEKLVENYLVTDSFDLKDWVETPRDEKYEEMKEAIAFKDKEIKAMEEAITLQDEAHNELEDKVDSLTRRLDAIASQPVYFFFNG